MPRKKKKDELPAKQERALLALLNEPSIEKAASAAGVHQRTMYRWLKQPAFEAKYRKCRRDAFGQAVGLMAKYATLAVNTLAKAMADPDAPYHVKVSAATAVLRFGREGIELDDLAVRIAALEAAAEKINANKDQSRPH